MKTSLFVIQVFISMRNSGRELRQDLHDLVRLAPERSKPEEKQEFYRDIAKRLAIAWEKFEYGVWEYSDDAAHSEAEFRKWCDGTIADAREATPYPGPIDSRYFFLTEVFLVARKSDTDKMLAKRCELPEKDHWHRATFRYLLSSIAQMDFTHVRSDAVLLRPGTDEFGITAQELQEEDYAYLRPLG